MMGERPTKKSGAGRPQEALFLDGFLMFFFLGKALASGRCPPTRWWFQLMFLF